MYIEPRKNFALTVRYTSALRKSSNKNPIGTTIRLGPLKFKLKTPIGRNNGFD